MALSPKFEHELEELRALEYDGEPALSDEAIDFARLLALLLVAKGCDEPDGADAYQGNNSYAFTLEWVKPGLLLTFDVHRGHLQLLTRRTILQHTFVHSTVAGVSDYIVQVLPSVARASEPN